MTIDINVLKYNNNDESFKIENLEDMPEAKGITLCFSIDHYKYCKEKGDLYDVVSFIEDNKICSEDGYHYVIDGYNVRNTVDDNKIINHTKDSDNYTYIAEALYDKNPNNYTISVLMDINFKHNYKDVECQTIKFIAKLLVDKKLTVDNVFRCFDLDKEASPLHLLERDKWNAFIKDLEDAYSKMKDNKFDDGDFYARTPIYTDTEVKKFLDSHLDDADKYAKQFQPDHRGIEAVTSYQSSEAGETKNFTTKNNNSFSYSVQTNIPIDTSHCSDEFGTLSGNLTPDSIEAEPVYPDLVVPPGQTVTFESTITENKQINNNSTLTIEELEKREKVFNVKDFKNEKKKVTGKPVNNNDPFPVDTKISELESHSPKVKIDKFSFSLNDCNHPDSAVGKALASNFAMLQDAILTISKRTESRIVKLENLLATTMRNLFRTSSRMQINCVYYGGQDTSGKKIFKYCV